MSEYQDRPPLEPVSDNYAPPSYPAQPPTPPPPQQWGTGGYYQPPPAVPTGKTNGMAIASLVLGICGLLLSWFLLGIPSILAVIFGHIALSQVGRDPRQGGRGMAIAGLSTGYVSIGLFVLFIAAVFAV
jgi:hypothetical protein